MLGVRQDAGEDDPEDLAQFDVERYAPARVLRPAVEQAQVRITEDVADPHRIDVEGDLPALAPGFDDVREDLARVGLFEEWLVGLHPGLEHGGGDLPLGLVELRQCRHAPLQVHRHIVVPGLHRLFHAQLQPPLPGLGPGGDQVFLALEVVEEGAPGHVGVLGDLVDRGAVVTLLREEGQGRGVDAVPNPLLAALSAPEGAGRFRGHVLPRLLTSLCGLPRP
ncbi:hypothetical protein R5U08_08130 [Streptomyces coeruleorubidus]|uniref:Uncharacterized protein n=1 Tax=Streptomyces coeruleorubidus TaxID=116188 RepID=A0ABZ0K8S9_STRC4|nr:hypothetical protein [Streptomyces coeruleorubidus]WOT34114.1 hypothetical protein R5U08_08130 [Streptomyces coeruleorubidus]